MGKALIYKQILSTYSFRKYIEISLENLYLDLGTSRVKGMGKYSDFPLKTP